MRAQSPGGTLGEAPARFGRGSAAARSPGGRPDGHHPGPDGQWALTRALARPIFTDFYRCLGLSWETSTFNNYHPEDSRHFAVLYPTLLCFTLLYYTPLYLTLLYFTLPYFTLLYFALLYFCFALLYSTVSRAGHGLSRAVAFGR